jgi:hypothetical protein
MSKIDFEMITQHRLHAAARRGGASGEDYLCRWLEWRAVVWVNRPDRSRRASWRAWVKEQKFPPPGERKGPDRRETGPDRRWRALIRAVWQMRQALAQSSLSRYALANERARFAGSEYVRELERELMIPGYLAHQGTREGQATARRTRWEGWENLPARKALRKRGEDIKREHPTIDRLQAYQLLGRPEYPKAFVYSSWKDLFPPAPRGRPAERKTRQSPPAPRGRPARRKTPQ